jgi:hypothetical protein
MQVVPLDVTILDCFPQITSQPEQQEVEAGGTAVFSVGASVVADVPISYRWMTYEDSDFVPLNDTSRISGTGTPTLTIADVQPTDYKGYYCKVSTECGSVFAFASLKCPPLTLTEPLLPVTVAPGDTATFSVRLAGGAYPQFAWYGLNSELLVDGPRISGATTPTLTIENVQAQDQGRYLFQVWTMCNGTGYSIPAILSCSPNILSQPPSEMFLIPDVTLSVTVPPGTSDTFQWRRYGIALSPTDARFTGVNTPTLTLLNNNLQLAGEYDCVVTNACGDSITQGTLVRCGISDINNDGFIDFIDFDVFVAAFESDQSVADINRDGFLDFTDFDFFVTQFELGC